MFRMGASDEFIIKFGIVPGNFAASVIIRDCSEEQISVTNECINISITSGWPQEMIVIRRCQYPDLIHQHARSSSRQCHIPRSAPCAQTALS